MPVSSFRVADNNVLFRWLKGGFDGVSKVGTWSTDSRVTIPQTQTDSASTSFNPNTGLLTISYTRTDAGRKLNEANSKVVAVAQQKNSTVKGFYTSAGSAGSFVAQPNTNNVEPEITSVSPLNKEVTAAATTYKVTVTTAGAWTVKIPSTVTWVTATPLKGTGNGTITITVAKNATNTRREAEIKIAGFTHTLQQEFR